MTFTRPGSSVDTVSQPDLVQRAALIRPEVQVAVCRGEENEVGALEGGFGKERARSLCRHKLGGRASEGEDPDDSSGHSAPHTPSGSGRFLG